LPVTAVSVTDEILPVTAVSDPSPLSPTAVSLTAVSLTAVSLTAVSLSVTAVSLSDLRHRCPPLRNRPRKSQVTGKNH